MPGMPNKHLAPINKGASPTFRYVAPRGKGVNWASCNQDTVRVKFKRNIPYPEGVGVFFTGSEVGLAVTVFATFAFAPLSIGGVHYGWALVNNVATKVVTSSVAGEAGYFLTGVLGTLGFASPAVRTTEYAGFNRPCSETAGVKF